jgi:hypothetical protein
MTYLLLRSLEHALFYILIAGVPYIIYHWTGRFFLASVGSTAIIVYAGTLGANYLRTWPSLAIGITLVLVSTTGLAFFGLLMDTRTPFLWGVVTFSVELAVVRAASVWNPVTLGEMGLVSPFWDEHGSGWWVGSLLLLGWTATFVTLRRWRMFRWARLFNEAPSLCLSLGLSGRRSRLPVYCFAGATIGLAAIHHMMITQRIQPAGFGICNSLVGFAVAFLAPIQAVWPLIAFGGAFVGARLLTALGGLPDATQVAEGVAGLAIIFYVLGRGSRHRWYGAED